MKNSLVVLLILCSVVSFSYGQDVAKVPAGLKKASEIDTNLLGLLVGDYSLRFETNLAADGFTSLGIKANFFDFSQTLGSLTAFAFSGYGLLAEVRMYPQLYRNGVYLLVETGVTSFTVNVLGTNSTILTVPLEGGLGYKWILGQFDIDLNFAVGKPVFVAQPANNYTDLNTYPYNLAYDGGILVGYRF